MGFHPEWSEIAAWIARSDKIIIKKLSRNDCSWADHPGSHQSGIYIPGAIQASRFFPGLENTNSDKPHIYDTFFETLWPASGEIRQSRLKHYSNKGHEFHFTRLPKEQFSNLSPASLILGGNLMVPEGNARYWFIVVDSVSDEAELIESAFSLPSDFHFGLFSPDIIRHALGEEEALIAELSTALRDGTLDDYIARQHLPSPDQLVVHAQALWLQQHHHSRLDPFAIEAPGDAVMRISRDIEYSLYKQAELRQRASQVAGLLLSGGDPVEALVRGFGQLDRLFLSAAQTRKSRAGLSFEHHVKRLLVDGRVRHEAQVVVGARRPDFVLPDVAALCDPQHTEAMVLSLKTTLRERWKQLVLERRHGAVFLATVDDRVPLPAIEEMARNDIVLVVPETLKKSKEAVYEKHDQVITFRHFFDEEIRTRRPALLLSG